MESLDRYKKEKKVGEGTYGVVYKAHDTTNGQVRVSPFLYFLGFEEIANLFVQVVAVKQIRLECEDEGVPSTAIREISIL